MRAGPGVVYIGSGLRRVYRAYRIHPQCETLPLSAFYFTPGSS